MNAGEREQVKLILDHEFNSAFSRAIATANKVAFGHGRAGQSGATVRNTVRLVFEDLGKVLDDLILKVGAVSREGAAMDLLQVAFREYVEKLLNVEFRRVATIASGRGLREPTPSVWEATVALFDTGRDEFETKLRIASYDFKGPATTERSVAAEPSAVLPKNPGGKPLAEHWDGMWADIAVQLWSGDLEPKSQADIKRAMFDWFNLKGIEIGDTAVTKRARALWLKCEAAQ